MSSTCGGGGTETLPPEEVVAPARLAGGPPVTRWDRYELFELLGKGGMGSVYKARDRRLGRTVAIKFLLGADPSLTMRFLREAHAQASIDHPNVCRVYDVGEVEGRAYIALQFVDGEPLHKAAARMSLDEITMPWARRIAGSRSVSTRPGEIRGPSIKRRCAATSVRWRSIRDTSMPVQTR
jgi:Protein kinase domain